MRVSVALLAAAIIIMPYVVAAASSPVQFWVLTDRGNMFLVEGPPPDRPPGFDTAGRLNTIPADDTATSLNNMDVWMGVSAGPGRGVPTATFGPAAPANALPGYDPERTYMAAGIIREWDRSRFLFSPYLIGDLQYGGEVKSYLGPARVQNAADLLERCNKNGTGVRCISNYVGVEVNPAHIEGYGYVLDVSAWGRTIIYGGEAGTHYEVMFTCPSCMEHPRAFHGVGGNALGERGFVMSHGGGRWVDMAAPDPPPHPRLRDTGLKGLSWVSSEADHIRYWAECLPDHAGSSATYSNGTLQVFCRHGSLNRLEGGAVNASSWRPLYAGWNHIRMVTDRDYILVENPGEGAALQIRQGGSGGCCVGFEGAMRNPNQKTAIIHNVDRHLTVMPPGGFASLTQPALNATHNMQWQNNPKSMENTTRLLSHAPQDHWHPTSPAYHGMFYNDNGHWPPYKVVWAEGRHISFEWPRVDAVGEISLLNVTGDTLGGLLLIDVGARTLMDAEIYDIRNDIALRTDAGRYKLWNGDIVERPYIYPWLGIQDNPAWEVFGVDLPADTLLISDLYYTIPIVKPTRLSDTYVSSIPCGFPAETTGLRHAVYGAAAAATHDKHLIEFYLEEPWHGPIAENVILQQVYLASRSYLDYIDGHYLAGDTVHIPVLPGRPYICTTIAPNILETQFVVGLAPSTDDTKQLGGRKHIVDVPGGLATLNHTNATYVVPAGVQSPRDGTISLDIQAHIGASTTSWGKGATTAANVTAANLTGPWLNGTIDVHAFVLVESYNVTMGYLRLNVSEAVPGGQFSVSDGFCYGRFSTPEGFGNFTAKTISVDADLGEHIPITIELVAKQAELDVRRVCDETKWESAVVQFLLRTFRIVVS